VTIAAAHAAIDREREAMRGRGFAGYPEPLGTVLVDHNHVLRITPYRFPDDTVHLYVEAAEVHDGAYGARIWPMSEAVHLLQNVTDHEFYVIGGRENERGSPHPA
jgi:hypothetical protein